MTPTPNGVGTPPRSRILIIVAVAFLIRLLVALPGLARPDATFSRPDSPSYALPARALVETGHYREEPGSERPATLRTPGFPALLAVLYATGASTTVVVLALCVIGALTSALIYLAGRMLGSEAAAIAGALLFALNITAVAFAPMLLSDSFFAFLVAAQLIFAVRTLRDGRRGDLALTAVLAGVATLVRPLGLPWVVMLGLLALLGPSHSWRRRLADTLMAIALFAGVLLPWMARNEAVGVGFQLESNVGNTVLDHMAAAVLAVERHANEEIVREELRAETRLRFPGYPEDRASEKDRIAYQVRRGRGILLEYPLTTLRLSMHPLVMVPDAATFLEILGETTTGRGTLAVIRQAGLLAGVRHYFGSKLWLLVLLIPALAVVAVTYCAAIAELLRWIHRRDCRLLYLFVAFVPFYTVIAGPAVVPRFQLPALPLICLMAGLALTRWRRSRHGQPLPFSARTSS